MTKQDTFVRTSLAFLLSVVRRKIMVISIAPLNRGLIFYATKKGKTKSKIKKNTKEND